jgi:hypothetical protein
VTEDKFAEALAELAVTAYRGEPPVHVLKALGVVVATALKHGTVTLTKKRAARVKPKSSPANGHSGPDATAPERSPLNGHSVPDATA